VTRVLLEKKKRMFPLIIVGIKKSPFEKNMTFFFKFAILILISILLYPPMFSNTLDKEKKKKPLAILSDYFFYFVQVIQSQFIYRIGGL